ASVNFMNLSTAHSLTRTKEVGIRKTLGSTRLGIVRQFLAESTLVTFLSLIVSIGITVLAMPFFNQLAGKEITLPLDNSLFWLALVTATILLGLAAGGYPALFMSRFAPSRVLKRGDAGVGGGHVRN